MPQRTILPPRTPKPNARDTKEARFRFFGAATTLVVYALITIIGAGIRFGWSNARFQSFATPAALGLVAAACCVAGGYFCKGKALAFQRGDERERLITLKAEAANSRIFYVLGLNLLIICNMLAAIFEIAPLRYMSYGLGIAMLAHILIAMLTKTYYEHRL
ncbi:MULTISPECIES: hypothetical protein [unclassified Bifidobacterium]|uniref:hypothetical protein n=1 Tax=unclassified Bifidobacterium TaxID=2608897 RepID=UPI0011282B3B|nr:MULTISPECIES: hypothetical protein [unclassified Bifidobacterium]TPF79693.1 hypothetical protein BW08_08480 [Bifidobacterium sp. UTCIF-24]TPF88635.1 hypothetical protein BW10_08960 [Bifidobacterium sp. UTBIF-56]